MKKMEWDQKMRYRPYDKWPSASFSALKKCVDQSPWRLSTHIQPRTGLLNDPCAFNWFNGRWHLFYQSFPFGPVHGLKSWEHLTSINLVDWQRNSNNLLPNSSLDTHGVYTGSGIVQDNALQLMYTGNVRDSNWQRHSYQLGTFISSNGIIHTPAKPLILAPPKGYTSEFRDPFLFQHEGKTYCLVGGQTSSRHGKILLYQQQNTSTWNYLGPLELPESWCGYMIECPNICWIDGHVVLIYCPQGLSQSALPYQNNYPNVAVIADGLNLDSLRLTGNKHLQLIDEGFDFYASRVTAGPDHRMLMISWIGLPDVTHADEQFGWSGCLSYPRELHVQNQRLYTLPCQEIDLLKDQQLYPKDLSSFSLTNGLAISFTLPANQQVSLDLVGLHLNVDSLKGSVSVWRDTPTEIRQIKEPEHHDIDITLFLDGSVFECYVNHGEKVLSGRFFPPAHEKSSIMMTGFTNASNLQYWHLRAMNQVN